MTSSRASDGHRCVSGDAAVVRGVLHILPLASGIALNFDDRHANRRLFLFGNGQEVVASIVSHSVQVLWVDVLVIYGQETTAVAIGPWKWEEVDAVVVVSALLFLLLPAFAGIALESGCVRQNRITPAVHHIGCVTLGHDDGIASANRNTLKTNGARRRSRTTTTTTAGRHGAAENTKQAQSGARFQHIAAAGVTNNFALNQVMQMIVR